MFTKCPKPLSPGPCSSSSIISCCYGCCSVAQLCRTLDPHELQNARLPWPLPSPGVYSGLCPLSQWCHPTISLSVALFSSCPLSFPASGAVATSWLFASGGRRIGASASASVLRIFKTDFLQDWLVWSPCSSGDSQESSPAPQSESINSLGLSLLYGPTLTSVRDYWKTIVLTICTFVSKVIMLTRFVIAFLPRSKRL